MKIALIGYGKMGKAIESIALLRGHYVTKIDPIANGVDFREINLESLSGVDVCIDFSTPTEVLNNAKMISTLGKNIVIGTTGWYDKMSEMQSNVKKVGCIWSGNFSIGMNVFFNSVKETAKVMDNLPEYDVAVCEIHHNQKKDSPGGSAQIIGKIILDNVKRKSKIVGECFVDRKPNPEELHVASVRCGSTPGTHSVLFDSLVDTIELKHTARGREGFAYGAILAAEFINGKKGFYNIEDLMQNIIKK